MYLALRLVLLISTTFRRFRSLSPLCPLSPFLLLWIFIAGCASQPLRDPEKDELAELSDVQLVGDLARPWGLDYQTADGVGLVVGLAGTGSDPPPSAERQMLISDMQARSVENPNSILSSPATSLVTVRAILPPGVKKGDPVDVEVSVPRRSETSSLRGGWLMTCRLREYGRINGTVAPGHLLALAQGNVLVDSVLSGSDDPATLVRGRVLGGGVATKTRNLGLVIRDEHLSVKTSAQIGEAINQRFHIYDAGIKRGVAKPLRDDFVELLVHPRYEQNLLRYVRVIQGVSVRESSSGVASRLEQLKQQLLYVESSPRAALQLEALGTDAIPVLVEGLKSNDPEIRLYAAEALAYLDDPKGIGVLSDTAVKEPAFRWRALMALEAMEHNKAHAALTEMVHVDSAEARYGAFRALRRQLPDDPMVAGAFLAEEFYLHVVPTVGQKLVHVTREERPEVVLFGTDIELSLPVVVFAGNKIVVKSQDSGKLKITRMSAGEDDQSVTCSRNIEDVVRSLVEVGATFPDVVQAISSAKEQNCLPCRLEFSAIPRAGRTYHPHGDDGAPIVDVADDNGELLGEENTGKEALQGEAALNEEMELPAPVLRGTGSATSGPTLDGPIEQLPPPAAGKLKAADPDIEGLDALEFDPLR